MTIPVLNFQDFIAADGERLMTTSLQVATVFGKQHAHVLRDIRALLEQLPESHRSSFGLVAYLDEKGESRAMYRVTRDGFTLLAMGFTGKKALAFKLAYIDAFNAMAASIKNQREGLQFDYLRKELEHKTKKEKVSVCAREMRTWQDEKPQLEGELDLMLAKMQPSLLPN